MFDIVMSIVMYVINSVMNIPKMLLAPGGVLNILVMAGLALVSVIFIYPFFEVYVGFIFGVIMTVVAYGILLNWAHALVGKVSGG